MKPTVFILWFLLSAICQQSLATFVRAGPRTPPGTLGSVMTIGVISTPNGPRWDPENILINEGDSLLFTDLNNGAHQPCAIDLPSNCSAANELRNSFVCLSGNSCTVGPFSLSNNDTSTTLNFKCIPHCSIGMVGSITVQPRVLTVGVTPGPRWNPENVQILAGNSIHFVDLRNGVHQPCAIDLADNCSAANELRDVFVCLSGTECTVGPFDNITMINYKCIPHCSLGMVGSISVIEPGSYRPPNASNLTSTTSNPWFYVWVHGGLMGSCWMGLVPLSIFVARYLKSHLGKWWFRVHLVLGLLILATATSAFIVIQVGFYKPIPYNKPHVILGLITFICLFLQSILGFVIDRLYSPDRQEVPWRDRLHWWFGRLLLLLSWVTLPLGLKLYAVDRYGDISADQGSFIAYGVAACIVLMIFAVAEWHFRPNSHHDASDDTKPLSGYHTISEPDNE